MDASPILWDVVEEHLDEAEFLFEMWERSAAAPDLTWEEVGSLYGDRLRAHLDGLAIAGEPALKRLLEPGLADEEAEPCRAAACALAMLELPGDEIAWNVLRALATAKAGSGLRAGIARAIEVSDRRGLDGMLLTAVTHGGGQEIAELWAALAARQVDPGPGVAEALRSELLPVQAAAARAAVRGHAEALWPLVWPLLHAADGAVRVAAIETAVAWGSRAGWERCLVEAQQGEPSALSWVGMLGGEGEVELLRGAARQEATRHAALRALGYSGRRSALEECLRWMSSADGRSAKLAAEAFGMVTGVDAYCEGYSVKEPDDGELPELVDDLATPLEADAEGDLPKPRSEAFEWWFREHGGSVDPNYRYLRGQAKTLDVVRECLGSAPTRTGRWLLQEIQLRSQGAVSPRGARLDSRKHGAGFEVFRECDLQRPPIWR